MDAMTWTARHPYVALAATLASVLLLLQVVLDRDPFWSLVIALCAAVAVAKFVLRDPEHI